MERLIIEVGGRFSGTHAVFHQFDTLPVRIGRGYDNDLIVNDPYISPNHLSITSDGERWVVTDLDSLNGIHLPHRHTRVNEVRVRSGEYITIGRTTLQILSASVEVAPALRLEWFSGPAMRVFMMITGWVSMFLTLGFFTCKAYLDSSSKVKPHDLISDAIPWMTLPLVWAGLWTLIGFTVTRRLRFSLYWTMGNLSTVLVVLLIIAGQYVDYITVSRVAGVVFLYCTLGLLSMELFYLNLGMATTLSVVKRIAIALVIVGCSIASIMLMSMPHKSDYVGEPKFSQTLKPPFAALAPSRTIGQFVATASTLFDTGNLKKK